MYSGHQNHASSNARKMPPHSDQYPYMYSPAVGQHPMTPMDFSYSQSMLPSNLLSSPSPYIGPHGFLPPQHSPYVAHQSFMPPHSSSPFLPPSANPHSLNRPSSSPRLLNGSQHGASANLEYLNFSRTILISGIPSDLKLHELLNEIDFGPLENVCIIDDPSSDDSDSFKNTKICIVSFVNTHLSYQFHNKYAKNTHNLRMLRERLKNAPELKINSSDSDKKVSSQYVSDSIKVKTLNYITEFRATRALAVCFKILDSDLVPLMEKAFRTRCAKAGEVEDSIASVDEENFEMEFVVHFTSIDSAIKLYEHYTKRMEEPDSDSTDDLVQLLCLSVTFGRDRCDRNGGSLSRKPQSHSLLSSSPSTSERKLSQAHFGSSSNRNAPSSKSISQENVRVSDLRADMRNLDLRSSSTGDHDQVLSANTGSERSNDSALDDESVGNLGMNYPANQSNEYLDPVATVADDMSYFPDSSFNSVYTNHNPADPNLYPHSVTFPMGGASSGSYMVPPYGYNVDAVNSCNRTLYLGDIHPKTTVEEIANNVRAGGLVESIRYYRNKRMCFITFIDPAIALKFYLSHQVLHSLVIRDNEINVNWAKNHSGPLHRDIAIAVAGGASRNVYIGLKMNKAKNSNLRVPDEQTLRADFSRFGDMEQINYYHNKDCGFMNFLNIADAIKVVECFENKDVERVSGIVGDNGEFFEKYCNFKISYGKDRCGNPLKFSFVKRDHSYDSADEDKPLRHTPQNVDSISEEAALVFGISTGSSDKPNASNWGSSDHLAESTEIDIPSQSIPEEQNKKESSKIENNESDPCKDQHNGLEGEVMPANISEENIVKSKVSDDLCSSHSENASKDQGNIGLSQSGNGNKKENGIRLGKDSECDEEEQEQEDDEDDISIIINPETERTPHSRSPRRMRQKPQKIYHNSLELTDLLNATLNNRGAPIMHSNYNYSFEQPGYVRGIPAPSGYYRPPLQGNSVYNGGSKSMPHLAQYSNGQNGPYSGSQVMSEYLAKSQRDNYLYAATLFNGEGFDEDLKDFKKQYRKSSRR